MLLQHPLRRPRSADALAPATPQAPHELAADAADALALVASFPGDGFARSPVGEDWQVPHAVVKYVRLNVPLGER